MRFIVNIQQQKRTNNDHSLQIGRYQSRATCSGIRTSANASVRILSNHVILDWYLGFWKSRSILILIIRCSCQWFGTSTTCKPPVRSVVICSVHLIEQADTAIVFCWRQQRVPNWTYCNESDLLKAKLPTWFNINSSKFI